MNYAYETDGAAIYRRSFAIIRAEARLDRFDAGDEKVAVRIIHASGMVEIADDIVFTPGFSAAASAALRAGAPIFCDAQMVAHGITRARLPADNAVICTLSDPRVPALAAARGTTRTAAAVELWREQLAGSVVVIGNAPTALFRLLEILQEPGVDAARRRHRHPRRLRRRRRIQGSAGRKRARAQRHRARTARRQRDGRGRAQRRCERNRMSSPATIYGVGLGPGDPELMSVKAARLIAKAGVIAHFRKPGRPGNARTLVDGMLAPGVIEEALEYPVTTEIALEDPAYDDALRTFYDDCVRRLLQHMSAGRDVTVLCEGDPFLYGSFMHLHSRITGRAPVVVVPGISGMSGCWTASGVPITFGDDVLTVVPATLDEATLARAAADRSMRLW